MLRQRVRAEIAAPIGPAEAEAGAIRAPLQKEAIDAATEGHIYKQAEILRNQAGGIAAYCEAINEPPKANADDITSACAEEENWAKVVASDPEFRYRPQGAPEAAHVIST